MSFLVAFNKILDIKLVQYALVLLVVIFLGVFAYTQIWYNGLKLQHALLEAKYAKMDTAVSIQNSKIEEANKMYLQYKTNFEEAQEEAIKLSKINEANKLKLKEFQFKPNSTCEDKIKQILFQYTSLKKK